jgi:hypothetical protein
MLSHGHKIFIMLSHSSRKGRETYRSNKSFAVPPLFGAVYKPPFCAEGKTFGALDGLQNELNDVQLLFLPNRDVDSPVSWCCRDCPTPLHYCDQDSYIEIQSTGSASDGGASAPRVADAPTRAELKKPPPRLPESSLDEKPKAAVASAPKKHSLCREYFAVCHQCDFLVSFGPHKGRHFGDVAKNEEEYCTALTMEPARNGSVSKFVEYLRQVRGHYDVLGLRRTPVQAKSDATFNKASLVCAFVVMTIVIATNNGAQWLSQTSTEIQSRKRKKLPLVSPEKAARAKLTNEDSTESVNSLGSDIEIVGVNKGESLVSFDDALKQCGRRDVILKANNPRLILALQGYYDGPVIVTTIKEQHFVMQANKKRLAEGKRKIVMIKDFLDSSFCEVVSVVPGAHAPPGDFANVDLRSGTELLARTHPTNLVPPDRPGIASLPRGKPVAGGIEPPCIATGHNVHHSTARIPSMSTPVHKVLSGLALEDMWNEASDIRRTGVLNSHSEMNDCMTLLHDIFKKGGYSADAFGLDVRASDVRIIAQKMGVCPSDEPRLATPGIRQCWAKMLKSLMDDNTNRFRMSLHEMLFLLSKMHKNEEWA